MDFCFTLSLTHQSWLVFSLVVYSCIAISSMCWSNAMFDLTCHLILSGPGVIYIYKLKVSAQCKALLNLMKGSDSDLARV